MFLLNDAMLKVVVDLDIIEPFINVDIETLLTFR